MFAFRLVLFCAAFAAALPCSATTYRWVDKAGQTVFSDQPPPPEAQIIEKKEGRSGGNDPQPQIPYATRQVAEKYPVILYTTINCAEACVRARSLLNERGVPFSEKQLTTDEEIGKIAKQMGTEAFIPGLKVGSQNIPGFEIAPWNDLLDLAGYPKAALPRR